MISLKTKYFLLKSLKCLIISLLSNPWAIALALNFVLLGIAFISPKKLLTPIGNINGAILGILVWGILGWRGYLVVVFYFLVGSGLTFVRMEQKRI